MGPSSVEEETVRTPGQEKHLPGTGGNDEDPGQDGTEDRGAEYEDTEDSVERPHISFRGGGSQAEHEETGENIEASQGEENVEKNV